MIPPIRFRYVAGFACLLAFGAFLVTAIFRVSTPSRAAASVGTDLQAAESLAPLTYHLVPASPTASARPTVTQTQAEVASSAQGVYPQNAKHLGFIWPVGNAAAITSPFGPRAGGFHHGTDIGCPVGTPIRSSQTGRVLFAGTANLYGDVVLLDHGSGYQTLYAHLSEIDSKVGQVIARGAVLGLCGQTGNATGPHLHFEVRYAGYVWDPVTFLP